MEQVTGIGGIFLRARDAASLRSWYRDHLGVKLDESFGGATFRSAAGAQLVWSVFDQESNYFPGAAMVNYRVASLDRMQAQLRSAGVRVVDGVEVSEFGRFGWAFDPEGNRFELWEPPAGS